MDMIRARDAARVACDVFGIKECMIYRRHRAPKFVLPRQVAYWLTRQSGRSLLRIGAALNRDQSTVRHGVLRISALMETDPDLRAKVELCQARLA